MQPLSFRMDLVKLNALRKTSDILFVTVRKKLCNKPTDVRVDDYQYNFKNTRPTVEKNCLAEAKKQVELRNTRSYFTEVLGIIGVTLHSPFKKNY